MVVLMPCSYTAGREPSRSLLHNLANCTLQSTTGEGVRRRDGCLVPRPYLGGRQRNADIPMASLPSAGTEQAQQAHYEPGFGDDVNAVKNDVAIPEMCMAYVLTLNSGVYDNTSFLFLDDRANPSPTLSGCSSMPCCFPHILSRA